MRGKKRIFSLLLSLVVLFTTFFTQAGLVLAASQQSGVDRTSAIKSVFKSVKDVDYQRALAQKFGVKVSNEGVVTNNNLQGQIKPDDKVRVIVQVDGLSTLEIAKQKNISAKDALSYENSVKTQQASVVNAVKKFGTIRYTYQNAFNGLSAVVKYKDIDNLRKIPGVKSVSVANMYALDMTTAVNMTNASSVWTDPGLKGEGTVVAIVDTGIDYTHKDMKLTDPSKAKLDADKVAAMGGPGKYFTAKVPYGYNFADQNDLVIPQASEHGMHVAGIVAANASDEEVQNLQGIKGVAPEAQLLAMKVFTNNPNFPSAYNDDIAAAIDDSVRHGADVINMSLGSTAGFVNLNDAEQLAIKNATDAGVVVDVSAGNSYYSSQSVYYPYTLDQDMATVGAPGLNPDTICVASYENTNVVMPSFDYNTGSETGLVGYTTSEVNPLGVLKGEYSLVYCGIGQTSDFLNPDGSPKDLTGKIALIKRGTLNFVTKKKNAQDAGAAGVIVYNNSGDAYINMATDPSITIPGIFISQTDGEKLLNSIDTVKISFNGKVTSVPNANANHMSDFSSWGTTPGLEFKPEVTAPGGQIYSTIPGNKYETMSGTSMASPHTAGATALVVEHLNKLGVKNDGRNFVSLAKDLVINSAQPIVDPAVGLPYLTRKQGAGLVQVDRAVKTNAYVTDGNGSPTIALKEIGNTTSFKLDLTNFGKNNLTFNLKDNYGVLTNKVLGGAFLSTSATNISGAYVSFDKASVTVPAGGKAEVNVTLTIPTATTKNIFAEGFITLASADPSQPNLGIPYMGFYGKWSGQEGPRMFDAPMWDGNTYYGETTLLDGNYYYLGYEGQDKNGYPVVNPDHMSFSPNGDGLFDSVMPFVSFMRNAKTFEVKILDSNGNVVRTIAQDENIRKNFTDQQTDFATAKSDWAWDGTVYDPSTGSYVTAPEGNYTVELVGTPDFDGAQPYKLDMPVKLDVTAPEVQITSSPALTDVNSYNLTWTGSDNTGIADYLIFVDDSQDPVAEVSPDKNEYALDLPNGVKTVTLMAVDYAGNSSQQTIDLNDKLISFDVPNNYTVNKHDFTINYTLSDSIRLFVGHVDVSVDGGTAVSNDKNATSYDVKDLADGQHQVVFNVYGTDDKLLAADTINVTVDTVLPIITESLGYTDLTSFDNIFPVESGASLTTRNFTFEALSSEPLQSATVNGVDAKISSFQDGNGNKVSDIIAPIQFTNDGPNLISFNIVDLAGNVNNYAYKVFVDTQAPVLKVTPDQDKVVLGSSSDTYKLTLEAQDTTGYRLYVNGEQIGYAESENADGSGTDKTFEYTYTVPAGQSVLNIKAVDFYGFTSEKNITFVRDVNAPVVTVTSPTEGQTFEGKKVTVSGKVTDDNSVTSVKVNGNEVKLDESGNFTTNVIFDNFGANTVNVTAVDFAGNTTTKTVNVTMNKPHVTAVALTPDTTSLERGQKTAVKATATYSDGTTVDVTDTATWTVEKGSVDKGVFTAPADFSGDVKVTATIEGVSTTATINVKVPVVAKLEASATLQGLTVGATSTLKATATYSDGTVKDVTGSVTWKVSDANLGKVSGNVFTALAAGDVNVQAVLDNATSNPVKVSVAKPAEVVKKIITVLASRLNVRTGNSTSYSRIGTLSKGQVIEYLGLVNGWYSILFNGRTAYVSGAYVKAGETTVYSDSNTKTGTVTAALLNVRSGASVSSSRVGTLRRNATVTVIESVNGWYKISYSGKTAYVSASYVKLNDSTVSSGSSTSTTSTKIVTVTASALNVRSAASTSSSRIGTLYRNARVTVLASVSGWYKISYNGRTGYIYAAYTK